MRSFIDNQGKTAWVFDEETHPLGKKQKVEEPKPAVVVQPQPVKPKK